MEDKMYDEETSSGLSFVNDVADRIEKIGLPRGSLVSATVKPSRRFDGKYVVNPGDCHVELLVNPRESEVLGEVMGPMYSLSIPSLEIESIEQGANGWKVKGKLY